MCDNERDELDELVRKSKRWYQLEYVLECVGVTLMPCAATFAVWRIDIYFVH